VNNIVVMSDNSDYEDMEKDLNRKARVWYAAKKERRTRKRQMTDFMLRDFVCLLEENNKLTVERNFPRSLEEDLEMRRKEESKNRESTGNSNDSEMKDPTITGMQNKAKQKQIYFKAMNSTHR